MIHNKHYSILHDGFCQYAGAADLNWPVSSRHQANKPLIPKSKCGQNLLIIADK